MKMKISIVISVCLNLVHGQEEICETLGGECISITDCNVFKRYIEELPSSREMIMKYHCGFDGITPKVCCQPDDCSSLELMSQTCNVDYDTEDNTATDFIRPICLPTSDITLSNQNIVLYVAGWGAVNSSESFSNIKQYVSLPYKPSQECQEAYNYGYFKFKLGKGHMCAGGEIGKDTCRGDSGGPLMYDNGKIITVVGVVSFGPRPCALKDVPAVYTKVYEYIPWIRTIIKP